jgi:hypothetical protein
MAYQPKGDAIKKAINISFRKSLANRVKDNTPVIIQLSAKGCISNLSLSNGRYYESGKNNDLSGFGADLSQWVKVSCHSLGK